MGVSQLQFNLWWISGRSLVMVCLTWVTLGTITFSPGNMSASSICRCVMNANTLCPSHCLVSSHFSIVFAPHVAGCLQRSLHQVVNSSQEVGMSLPASQSPAQVVCATSLKWVMVYLIFLSLVRAPLVSMNLKCVLNWFSHFESFPRPPIPFQGSKVGSFRCGW